MFIQSHVSARAQREEASNPDGIYSVVRAVEHAARWQVHLESLLRMLP